MSEYMFNTSYGRDREFVCYYNGVKCDKTFSGMTAAKAAMRAQMYLFKETKGVTSVTFDLKLKKDEKETYTVICTRTPLNPPVTINGMELKYSNTLNLVEKVNKQKDESDGSDNESDD